MPTSPYRPMLLALALVGAGCAHGAATTASALAEPEATAPPLPTPRSFAPDGATVFLRFDTARMRGLPYERELGSLVTSAGTWQRLGYGSESDPIHDVDVMLCFSVPRLVSTDGILSDRWTFVLVHPHDEATVRRRFESMARASDRPLVWADIEGFSTARLPVPESGFVEHGVAITSPREVVVAPLDELPAVSRRAGEHRHLREAAAAIVDPSLVPTSDSELALVDIRTRSEDRTTIDLPYGGSTARIEHLHATLERVDDRLFGVTDLEFATASAADESARAIVASIARLRGDRYVRMFGVGELLDVVTTEVSDRSVRFTFTLDDHQAALVLSLVSAMLVR